MPLILERSGTVFLHMSRTGGTWVRGALSRAGVPCRIEGNIHAAYHECPAFGEGFTIIRNPLQWYPSIWAHEQLYGDQLYGEINDWVRRITMDHPRYMTWLHNRYVGPRVRVLRNEQLAEDLRAMLQAVNEDFDYQILASTPPLYVGARFPSMCDRVQLSDKSRRLIRNSEYEIFDRYYPEA